MLLAQLDISDKNVNPIAKFNNIASIVNLIVPLLFGLAAIAFFIMLLVGGYTILTAAGDAEKVKQAQKIFKFAVIGFVLVLTAFLIIKIAEIVFKIRII